MRIDLTLEIWTISYRFIPLRLKIPKRLIRPGAKNLMRIRRVKLHAGTKIFKIEKGPKS
jgi:hypothetical protein